MVNADVGGANVLSLKIGMLCSVVLVVIAAVLAALEEGGNLDSCIDAKYADASSTVPVQGCRRVQGDISGQASNKIVFMKKDIAESTGLQAASLLEYVHNGGIKDDFPVKNEQVYFKPGAAQFCEQIIAGKYALAGQSSTYIANNFGNKDFTACKRPIVYTIPRVALFSALIACGCGFFAIFYYADFVMQQPVGSQMMAQISQDVRDGAKAFLHTEYKYMVIFVGIIFVPLGFVTNWHTGGCFLVGGFLSGTSGYCGMFMATQANARTAWAANESLAHGLKVAFRAGAVMGLSVVTLGLTGLTVLFLLCEDVVALAGFGAGSSAVALFARVGGGIYTKAADVGADLVGKVEADIPEDDPRNPATIADNVGDNVGDVAGMGADLFESYVGSIVAAGVLAVKQEDIFFTDYAVALPFWICAVGLMSSVVFTWTLRCKADYTMNQLLSSMRFNVFLAAGVILVGTLVVLYLGVGPFEDYGFSGMIVWKLWGCVATGLVAGVLIGWITEYFTSGEERPTQSIAESAEFGAGPVIIQGLGQGMLSTTIPLVLVVVTIIVAFKLGSFYGTAIASVGMLSTLGVTMATDAYGPVADNAGGIAEMSDLPDEVRERTDLLDALGNTTAATGKGFANGSAVLSAMSLLAAFTYEVDVGDVTSKYNATLVNEYTVCGVLIGSLLPYIFSAFTMLAVGRSAQAMIVEVRRQFREIPGLREGAPGAKADHTRCVAISTAAALREMIFPSIIAVVAPLTAGLLMGLDCLTGLLVGALSSGYLLAVMMSNAGGAWDNAKKYVEAGHLKDHNGNVMGKRTEWHKAAVSGDTVGDPFKDTSGPSLNILIKLMTRFTFVFVSIFKTREDLEETSWGGFGAACGALVITIFFLYWLGQEDKKIRAQARAQPAGGKAEAPAPAPAPAAVVAPAENNTSQPAKSPATQAAV